jgi:sulfane dehydrogenase subunit SoxC
MSPPGARMDPAATTKRQRPPSALDAPITAVADLYVIGHFGIAHVPTATWRLRVGGLVRQPLDLGLDDLRALPSVRAQAVLECFGNPLRPDEPTRRVGNVVWRGAPVSAVLDLAGADDAGLLWAEGRDAGVFDGAECTEYLKDVPLDVVRERGILAYEMNGEPLTAEHGAPARLFVPGYFGTNNVKWLRSLTVAEHRPEHLFTTTLYQRPVPGTTRVEPVRDLDVNSIVTEVHTEGAAMRVAGWVWGSVAVTGVEVGWGRDGSATDVGGWVDADLAAATDGPFAWRRFTADLEPDPAARTVCARATAADDAVQPLQGARNACHVVAIAAPRVSEGRT